MAGFFGHRWHHGAAEFADKTRLADTQTPPINQPLQAKTRCAVDFFGSRRRTTESAGDRMFGAVFQGGGEAQALIAVERAEGADRAQRQASFGEGAGLVENHRVDLVQAFQHMAAGQQQTEFVQCAGGGGEGGRRRQRQGARAGRHQHRQHDPEGSRGIQLPPQQANRGGSDQRQQQEPLRGAVGDFRQARFFGLGAIEQANDGREASVLAQGLDLDGQCAFDVHCAGGDRVAEGAWLRQVFAGQQ
ncbi:hypothetical protein D9M71_414380 [compost metagenome]